MAQVKDSTIEIQAKPIWAEIMRAAVAVASQATLDEEDLLESVGIELRRLNLHGAIMLLTDDGFLEVQGTPSGLKSALRKLSGHETRGYKFEREEVDIYRQLLLSSASAYDRNRETILQQIIPENFRPIASKIFALMGDHPMIYAPLLIEGQPLGVMAVSAEWLTPDDVPMVASLADHIAISLIQIRTRAEMRQTLERERLRIQISEAAANLTDLPEILDRILALTAEATGANAGAIALLSESGESLRFHNLFGLPQELARKPIQRDSGLTWQLIESRKPMLVADYANEPYALRQWIEAGVRAVLGVPLIRSNKVIGVIDLFIRKENGAFTEEHMRRAVAVSHVAAGIIHNAQLYEQAKRLAEEADALRKGAIAISSSLDTETVLFEIAQQAKELLKADGSRIHLLDPEGKVLKCVVALQPNAEDVINLEIHPGEGLTGYVLKNGEPLLVNHPLDHPQSIQNPGTPAEEEEVLALAPLIRRQRTMGVMTVRRDGYERKFHESELHLLTAFASQASVVIENAHLYGQIEEQVLQLEDTVAARTHELFLSEARYRTLVETSLAGIYQLDEKAHIVYVNQQLAEMVELTPEKLEGRSVADFLAPEDRSQVIERALARIRGEGPPTELHEVDLLSWTGRRIPVILAVSLITDKDGKPGGVSGLVLDISRRKVLEAALRTERDRLSAILNNVGDAVLVTNAKGVIEYVNPAWEKLNGYSSEETLGNTPNLINSGMQDQDFYTEMWSTILSNQEWSGEVVNKRKDGSTYEAALTVTPVQDEEGNIVNFVGVQHDISILKELDRLKSQFVSDVSHELRTPLTNIRLYLDLLRHTEYDQRAGRYIETLSRESERLSSLIEDLLSLSRLEVDAIPINSEPVDLNQLLSALGEDRSKLASQYGLELRIECEANVPPALGDWKLLSQVFSNLLTNALNYTPKGGSVIIRTRKETTEKGVWAITEFIDSGYGISPSEQPLIFERFFRGQAAKPANGAGTGLGLAICKEISELHGGKITVESAGIPGQGSTFTVWLPTDPT